MCSKSTLSTCPEMLKLGHRVREIVPAEKVFLLGRTFSHLVSGSVFGDSGTLPVPTAIHILVLVRRVEGQSPLSLLDKLEASLEDALPVIPILLHLERFNTWLQEGHPFAARVAAGASLIYDEGLALADSGLHGCATWETARLQILDRGFDRMSGFLAGAELYRVRRQNGLAAFMLHQSVEQGLGALLQARTGYSADTHNIERLLRYCSLVAPGLVSCLHGPSERSRLLFQKLKQAYITGRYGDAGFNTQELLEMEGRVRGMMEVYKKMVLAKMDWS